MATATGNDWTIKHTAEHGHYAVIWADDLKGDQGWAVVELDNGRIDAEPVPAEWSDSEREAVKLAKEWDDSSHYQGIQEKIEALLEKADPDTKAGRAKLDAIAKALGL